MRKTDENNIETPDNVEKQENKKECCCHRHCHGKRCRGGRFFIGILAIVGIFAIGSAVFGGKHCYAGPHHWKDANVSERMQHMSERMLDKVDASDEQEAQVQTIIQKYEPNFTNMRTEHKSYRDAFLTAIKQDTINDAELEQIRQNMTSQMNEKSVVLTQMIAEVAKVLTPEQRQVLVETFEKRRHHW